MSDKGQVIRERTSGRQATSAGDVAERLREMIQSRELSAGDRLPPERDLAKTLGVSRPTLRAGIRSLSAVGVLRSRQGAGTFVAATDGSPALDDSILRMFSALHGITQDELFDARLALEMSLAGLAAKRATSEQISQLSEEIAGMYASFDDPDKYRVHDAQFHQIVAAASGNRILTALMNTVAEILFEYREKSPAELKRSAEQHHNIYRAIRDGDAEAAERAMRDHLVEARRARDIHSL